MSTTVDPETGEIIRSESGIRFPDEIRLPWQPMTKDEAEKVTADITAYGIRLCHLVREAKERKAWAPLGFDTWEDYCEERLRFSRQRADQLYKQALKLDYAAEIAELAATDLEIPEWTLRGLSMDDLGEIVTGIVLALPQGEQRTRKELAAHIEHQVRVTVTERRRAAEPITSTAVDVDDDDDSEPPDVEPSPEVATAAEGESVGGDGSTPATSDAPIPPIEPAATGEDAGDAEDHPVEGEQAADPDPAAGSGSPQDPPTVDGPDAVTAPAASGPSHLLALAYAALDGQWESPNLGIDAESFWLPLIALLGEQAA